MKHIKHCSVIAALAAAALTFAGAAPAALAANDGATQDAVVATRSFPKTNAVKKNPFEARAWLNGFQQPI